MSRDPLVGVRMVHLRTVPSAFHARVLVARLGADGILTAVRGSTGGPYPLGEVAVLVSEQDEAVARQLLLADDVEAALAEPVEGEPGPGRRTARVFRTVVAAGVLVAAAVAAVVPHLT